MHAGLRKLRGLLGRRAAAPGSSGGLDEVRSDQAKQLAMAAETLRTLGKMRNALLRGDANSLPLGPSLGYAPAGGFGDFDLEEDLRRAVAGDGPILVGPWLSEVGFELLYWIPFLRWLVDAYAVDRSRLIVLSRGGVASWYADVATGYDELLDHVAPDDIRASAEARQSAGDGSVKQLAIHAFDERILAEARSRRGIAEARTLHPSLMYRAFTPFWAGVRSNAFLRSRLRFAAFAAPDHPVTAGLPDHYVAAKFYGRASLPADPRNTGLIADYLRGIASQRSVVMLDHGFTIDDHAGFDFPDIDNVIRLSRRMHPADNLRLQSAVIAGAEMMVGTYGGLTYLPLLYGRPAIGVISHDDHLLGVHGGAAYHMAETLNASLSVLHADALRYLSRPGP